jgi:predicted negative regulator of RcsB-dependent stress response
MLQFAPAERVLVTAAEKESEWVVTLGDVIVEPTRPVEVARTWTNAGEPRVIFDVEKAARVHWVIDPIVQDSIAIVTAGGPPQGLLAPRNFVEFNALSTAQGLAVVSRADDLYVRATSEGVLVSRGSGLTLSSGDGPGYSGAGSAAVGDPSAPGRMDFERWRYSPGDTYIERKHYHQQAVATSTGAEAIGARIKYAKFLLSYRLGSEAYTMLQSALFDQKALENDPAFRALRGVAYVMMGRAEDATTDLSLPALADDAHSALWLGVAYAEVGDWADAWRSFENAEQAFAFYGSDLQALFRVKAAEAALASGDIGTVEFNLDRVPDDTEDKRWLEQAKLTRAYLYESSGRIDEALEIFDQLRTSDYRSILARASFAHAKLRHQLGALDDEALINELEAIKFMWRGDDLELAILEELGELQVAQGNVSEGLKTWRGAVGRYAQTERGRRIASRMTDIFSDLYLSGGADDMDPLDALTVYYEFRELTPIGRRGDALIRNLADRLVEFDLLDKAGDLLRHQVQNRLRGTARAQVAAKLALIELMNHEPDRALQSLRSTKQVRLPENLSHRRRLLEARALTELGLFDHALDLLSETSGEGVDDLIADIYWESQQWDIAARHFEDALGERWRDPLELEEAERFQVMRAAISYSLADDAVGLDRVRSKFGDLMRAGPDAAGFAVVTDPIETQGVAFRDLARSVASTDTLDSFVDSMRESFAELPEGSESAIN